MVKQLTVIFCLVGVFSAIVNGQYDYRRSDLDRTYIHTDRKYDDRRLMPRELEERARHLESLRHKRVSAVQYENYRPTPSERVARANYIEANRRGAIAPVSHEYRQRYSRPVAAYRPRVSCDQGTGYTSPPPSYRPTNGSPPYGPGYSQPAYNPLSLGGKKYVGKGIYGQPVVYGRHEPVRNILRSLAP